MFIAIIIVRALGIKMDITIHYPVKCVIDSCCRPVVKTVLFGGFGLSYNHKTKIDEMRKQNKVVVVFSY